MIWLECVDSPNSTGPLIRRADLCLLRKKEMDYFPELFTSVSISILVLDILQEYYVLVVLNGCEVRTPRAIL